MIVVFWVFDGVHLGFSLFSIVKYLYFARRRMYSGTVGEQQQSQEQLPMFHDEVEVEMLHDTPRSSGGEQ